MRHAHAVALLVLAATIPALSCKTEKIRDTVSRWRKSRFDTTGTVP
jgi:hypothetical protein